MEDRAEIAPPPKGGRRKKVEEVESKAVNKEGENEKGEDGSTVTVASTADEMKEDVSTSSLAVSTATATGDLTTPVPSTVDAGLHQTISTLTAERNDLQIKLAALESSSTELAASKKQLGDAQTIIAHLEGEKGELETRVSGLLGEAESAKTLRDDLERAQAAQKDAELKAKEAEEKSSRMESEAKAKTADLEKGLERAREREGGLEAEIGRLRQVSSLRGACHTEIELMIAQYRA